jgi:predicted nucleic acid-binding Zn ribbon protein
MGDDPLRDCPECGKPELDKLVSAAGFRLKGGGWYETDFKSGGKKNVHDSGSGSSSEKSSGGGCGSGGCGCA